MFICVGATHNTRSSSRRITWKRTAICPATLRFAIHRSYCRRCVDIRARHNEELGALPLKRRGRGRGVDDSIGYDAGRSRTEQSRSSHIRPRPHQISHCRCLHGATPSSKRAVSTSEPPLLTRRTFPCQLWPLSLPPYDIAPAQLAPDDRAIWAPYGPLRSSAQGERKPAADPYPCGDLCAERSLAFLFPDR